MQATPLMEQLCKYLCGCFLHSVDLKEEVHLPSPSASASSSLYSTASITSAALTPAQATSCQVFGLGGHLHGPDTKISSTVTAATPAVLSTAAALTPELEEQTSYQLFLGHHGPVDTQRSTTTLAAAAAPNHISSSRPSTSALITPAPKEAKASYHVFLSHYSLDSSTVVDVLRAFLESKGINCFVDNRTEEDGGFPDNLRQAIRNSQVHIVVLSEHFAKSSWCLEEVALIMHQHPVLQSSSTTPPVIQANAGHIFNSDHAISSSSVLPVFYGIKPADVRYPQPGSAYDLSKLLHQGCTTKDRTDRWSKALHELSNINGFDWSDPDIRLQLGVLIEKIERRVGELLDCFLRPSTYVVPHFEWENTYSTQMEQAEKALICSEHVSDSNVNIVSIGISGVHKSEFAKILFNRTCKNFHAACILLNVNEQAKSLEGLLNLQSTLLAELLGSQANLPRFQNTEKGLQALLDRLKYIKCLIVIDDIDDTEERLRSLLVLDRHQLCKGSRLVLTSRFSHVVSNRHYVDETIDLCLGTKLDPMDSRKQLAICCNRKDVHEGFIDHLNETFSMLGLCVSRVSKADLLNVARERKVSVVLVILSRSFNVDSPHVLGMLEEASTITDVKFVYVFYGLQSGPAVDQEPKLGGILFKNALTFSVNFDSTPTNCKLFDKGEFKSLVNKIVYDLMQHEYKLTVTDFPVGLMKRQHEIEENICRIIAERSKLKCVGILGMGGIGKTTIARALYNNIHKKFEGSVFLPNVRAQAKEAGLARLQMAIFDNVLGDDQVVKFSNIGEGSVLLSKRLRGTHTLVILDDVNDRSHLDALLFPLDLAPGSVAIITSRDRHILEAARVDQVLDTPYLDSEDARKLFYWHAFLKPLPPIHLRDLADKVIRACGGLPLSLQVIGAHVYNHDDDHQFWEETLGHLQNADHEIFKVLKVSVDALGKTQQEAFLDVCCFLIGKTLETARRVWGGCGWNGTTIVDVLRSKCLITVDHKDGTIGMHDQIRDMGRYIADDPERIIKTHIWNATDASEIPHDKLAQERLRGFAWISQEEEVAECDVDAVKRLFLVKLLLLRNVQIDEGLPNLPAYNQIRWLQWQRSPFQVLPPGLSSARKLRVLDLSGSTKLEAVWRDSSDQRTKLKVPERLQELNLTGCKNLAELPQFDTFLRELEWFSLNGCERIDHLHNSISSLDKLEFLDLTGCTRLRSLPDEIKDLHALQKLLLSHCSLLDSLPQHIGNCSKLIEVCLDHTGLSTLPESFGDLKNLEKLTLNSCPVLASLPLSIGGLGMLRVCNLSDCPKLQGLPDSFCNLTNLDDLAMKNCDLEELPERIGNLHKLRSLSLEKNLKMRRLPPSVGEMRSLLVLNLGYCPLQDNGMPKELERLECLEELDMRFTDLVKIPPSFEHLGKLSRLHLHHCAKLEQADFLPSNLEFVNMGHCPRLQRVTGLNALKSLVHLVLCNCYQLRELNGLGGLDRLETLNISGCGSLYSSAVAYSCPQAMRRLQLSGSHVLASKRLLQLPSLEHITCFGSEMPEDFEDRLTTEIEAVESANELVMTIDLSTFISNITTREPCFAIVICLVSHDQGWSDGKEEYGSYLQSPTFVEAVLMRGGLHKGTVQLLYRNRHAEMRDQVHLCILRRDSKVLSHAEVGDKIEIRARSLYQAWRITVKHASYRVLTDGLHGLEQYLQLISVGWVMNTIRCSQRSEVAATCPGSKAASWIQALNIDSPQAIADQEPQLINAEPNIWLKELWKNTEVRFFIFLSCVCNFRDECYAHIHATNSNSESCIFCTFTAQLDELVLRGQPHATVYSPYSVISQLNLGFLLQHVLRSWTGQHEEQVKKYFLQEVMFYLDENDRGAMESQILALLVAFCSNYPPLIDGLIEKAIKLQLWRSLLSLYYDGTVDLQSLPSTYEMLFASLLP